MIGKVVDSSQRTWDKHLPFILSSYNATVHSSTGFTPNYLFFARELRGVTQLALHTVLNNEPSWENYDEYTQSVADCISKAHDVAREKLKKKAQWRKDYFDRRVKISHQYNIGDKVWRFCPRRYTGRTPKWQRCFDGPFLIKKVVSDYVYVIQKSPNSRKIVAHADHLKPYGNVWFPSSRQVQPESEKMEDEFDDLNDDDDNNNNNNGSSVNDTDRRRLPAFRQRRKHQYLNDYIC